MINSYSKSILEYLETSETTGIFPNEIDSIYSLIENHSQTLTDRTQKCKLYYSGVPDLVIYDNLLNLPNFT
ncbi:hypothetical protein BpHYR1_040176 [Brachionus plicatilis]|uniref:Uncharacterized protein n=1 Tax=Brachionus plicatilis TaxID=10195 RepID=A0A3M7PKM4_BRAPC|nr:hypothetical protein BpHYR1_040176 [Brachionus plicatilis]